MRGTRGHTLAVSVTLLALVACGGTGNRLDTDYDGGRYLPIVQQVDSGWINLEVDTGTDDKDGNPIMQDGRLFLDGNDLVLADPHSGTAVRLLDNSNVTTAEQIYDIDGNGLPDYIVVTIRALSAQAAAGVTATDENDIPIAPADFIKVGGAAFLPLDANFSAGVEVTLPVHPAAEPTPGEAFSVYKFVDYTVDDRQTAADVGTGTGLWEYFGEAEVDGSGTTVIFNAKAFGQYCIATDHVVHNQGGGTDL